MKRLVIVGLFLFAGCADGTPPGTVHRVVALSQNGDGDWRTAVECQDCLQRWIWGDKIGDVGDTFYYYHGSACTVRLPRYSDVAR